MKLRIFLAVLILHIIGFSCFYYFSSGPGRDDPDFLHASLSSDPTTLDPVYIVDVIGGFVSAKLFGGLVKHAGSTVVSEGDTFSVSIEPELCDTYEISADGLAYRFRIRPGVKWPDGSSLTSADVVSSFKRLLDPRCASPRTWVLAAVEGAKQFASGATDEVSGLSAPATHEVAIRLTKPFAPFLGMLAMPSCYIHRVRGRIDRPDSISGTGPFLLGKWERGSSLELVRNEAYFQSPPAVRGIRYRVIRDEQTAYFEFLSGGLDYYEVPDAKVDQFQEERKSAPGKFKLFSFDEANVYYIGLNNKRPPFDDPRVRQALNLAVDRENILSKVVRRGTLSHGPIPPGIEGYTPGSRPYPFDPQRARSLLVAAGLGKGFKMEIWQKENVFQAGILSSVIYDLSKIGVDASLRQSEWSALKTGINKGELDAYYMNWTADYPDAENFLFPLFHSSNHGSAGNRAFYSNSEVDRLIDGANASGGGRERLGKLSEAERLIFEDAPWIFLWHGRKYIAVNPRIRAFTLPVINNCDKGDRLSFEKPGQL